jgi:hypothetical protein
MDPRPGVNDTLQRITPHAVSDSEVAAGADFFAALTMYNLRRARSTPPAPKKSRRIIPRRKRDLFP